MTIYNLTQHLPTPTQEEAGVGKPLEGASMLLDFKTYDEAVNETADRAIQLVRLLHAAGARSRAQVIM